MVQSMVRRVWPAALALCALSAAADPPAADVKPRAVPVSGGGDLALTFLPADGRIEARRGGADAFALDAPSRHPRRWIDPRVAAAIPGTGEILVADAGGNRVVRLSADGRSLGEVEAAFFRPHALSLAGKYLLVRNEPQGRLDERLTMVFDDRYELVAEMGRPNGSGNRTGAVVPFPVGMDFSLPTAELVARAPAEAAIRPIRRHAQTLEGSGTYDVRVGGGLDEFVTENPRSPAHGVFQPNRWVRIANAGAVPIENPRLVVNGRRNWFSYEDIAAGVFRPGMTDEEKAYAVWAFCCRTLTEGPSSGEHLWGDTRSVARFLNTLGTGACGTYNLVLPLLGEAGGLRVHSGVQADGSHAVQTEEYDGQQRYFDCLLQAVHGGEPQPQGLFALRHDNTTVASSDEIRNDHYLYVRAGADPYTVSLFGPNGHFWLHKDRFHDPWRRTMTLRPGESIVWRWRSAGNAWIETDAGSSRSTLAAGVVRFEPRLGEADVRRDAAAVDRFRFAAPSGGTTLEADGGTGEVVYRLACPYLITAARAEGRFRCGGSARAHATFAISFDRAKWTTVASASGGGTFRLAAAPARPEFRTPKLTHELWVRLQLAPESGEGTVAVEGLAFELDFQANVLSLPSLGAGENRVEYRDDTPAPTAAAGARRVEITHAWIESDASPAPPAPALKSPADGTRAPMGTAFEWAPVEGAASYEFCLSPREDLAWPLLPSFRVLLNAEPKFLPTAPDALVPGRTYRWRVRARNADGVWGAWSATARFTAAGPRPVRGLRTVEEGGRVLLRWDAPETAADGAATAAAAYEVYGSPERGFTPLRAPAVRQINSLRIDDPANRLGTTDKAEFDVTDRSECFYRVAAVDAQGTRGAYGPYVEVRHPRLLGAALPEAAAGKPYAATIGCVLNNGMLVATLRQGTIRWMYDTPTFALAGAPAWLAIDAKTGALTGTPPQQSGGEAPHAAGQPGSVGGGADAPSPSATRAPPSAGEAVFKVTAEDGRGGKDVREFRIAVR